MRHVWWYVKSLHNVLTHLPSNIQYCIVCTPDTDLITVFKLLFQCIITNTISYTPIISWHAIPQLTTHKQSNHLTTLNMTSNGCFTSWAIWASWWQLSLAKKSILPYNKRYNNCKIHCTRNIFSEVSSGVNLFRQMVQNKNTWQGVMKRRQRRKWCQIPHWWTN